MNIGIYYNNLLRTKIFSYTLFETFGLRKKLILIKIRK